MAPALLFSMRISAVPIRATAVSRSAGFFKSRTIERLLRLRDAKFSLKPPDSGGHCRNVSPPGGSTLMTSAPISASSIPQKGPAAT